MPDRYVVEVGKDKSSYKPKYSGDNLKQMEFYYVCLNIHSGYKKRLVDKEDNKILHRYIS